jgi:hypothetical protein
MGTSPVTRRGGAFGRRAALPAALRTALHELFGPGIDDVHVIEHSWFARLHGRMIATTRRRRIYLRGPAESFFQNPEIVLHEFFHVMRQWETRELSVVRYVLEWLRRGYWDNRFEIEAREFAADQLHRFRAMVSRHEAASGISPESLRARTARLQTPPAPGPDSG